MVTAIVLLNVARARVGEVADKLAATGIGDETQFPVTWVNFEEDPAPVTRIALRYEDSDLDSDDLICSGSVTMTAGYLHDGGFTFNCGNGSTARFTLRNTNRGTPTVAR